MSNNSAQLTAMRKLKMRPKAKARMIARATAPIDGPVR
jgi:hypothetical protein